MANWSFVDCVCLVAFGRISDCKHALNTQLIAHLQAHQNAVQNRTKIAPKYNAPKVTLITSKFNT